ncbi:hypothetical protein ANO11243_008230 [Dothideomycetidae sp. 11243]|nr:hypothetical protein ANO11243_008230 [fungal sp. No.11243]
MGGTEGPGLARAVVVGLAFILPHTIAKYKEAVWIEDGRSQRVSSNRIGVGPLSSMKQGIAGHALLTTNEEEIDPFKRVRIPHIGQIRPEARETENDAHQRKQAARLKPVKVESKDEDK